MERLPFLGLDRRRKSSAVLDPHNACEAYIMLARSLLAGVRDGSIRPFLDGAYDSVI